MVETEDDFLRRGNHRALNVNQQPVRIRYSGQRNASGAHDRYVSVNSGKRLHCQRPNQHSQPRINHTTGYDHLEPICGGEQIRDRQRVRDDLRRLALQVARNVIDRRPGVYDDALIRLNQFGAGAANRLLLRQLPRVPGRKSELIRTRCYDAGPAMCSLARAVPLETRQAPPNRRNRGPYLLGNLLKCRKFNLLQILGDSMLTRLWLHLKELWHILKYFASSC